MQTMERKFIYMHLNFSNDFRNSPKMAAHDLDTYIFIFTKIGMLSPHFSAKRPAFLKLFFQWGSFDIGLIRVRASPEFTTVTSTMSRLNFRTPIKHCAAGFSLASSHLLLLSCSFLLLFIRFLS